MLLLMQDDVVSSVSEDQQRFEEANERTLRWLDRCIQVRHTHTHPIRQQDRAGAGSDSVMMMMAEAPCLPVRVPACLSVCLFARRTVTRTGRTCSASCRGASTPAPGDSGR